MAIHLHPALVAGRAHPGRPGPPRGATAPSSEGLGAEVRILDIEGQDADGFAAAFDGCDAVVFAAGGGPDGNIERKRTVDLEGSLKSIEGATEGRHHPVRPGLGDRRRRPAARRHRRRLAGVRRGEARRRRRAAGQRPRVDDPPAGPPHRRARAPARVALGQDVARGDDPPRRTWPPRWRRCSTTRPRSAGSGTWSAATCRSPTPCVRPGSSDRTAIRKRRPVDAYGGEASTGLAGNR